MLALSGDLVVNVSHILDKVDVVAKVVLQNSAADIRAHVITGVAHMGVVVHRWPTTVPCNVVELLRHKVFLCPGQGVVDFQDRGRRRDGFLPRRLLDGFFRAHESG